MPNIVEIVVRAKDDTKAGFAAAGASADSMNAKLQKIGMIGAAGLGAVAVASVAMAAKFDSSMELIHTQAGVAQSQIAGLKQGVLDLAGQVGFSPGNLSDALFHIESSFASIGIKGPQAMSLLKIAAEGAAVGNSDLVDTTNALDATIASGISGVKSFSGAMGALNAIVGSGDMHMQDLNEAMGTGIMAIAKSYGQSIIQVGAALATLGDNNIRGAKAATDLRMAWQAIQSPMKAGVGILKDLGINSQQLAQVMTHQGLTAALQEFVDHLKAAKIPISDWGEYVTKIFGKKAGVGIAVLVDQLDRVKSKIPDITSAMGNFGDAWTKTQQTATQQWHQLQAQFDAVAISLGEKLMPYAEKLMSFLSGHISVILDVAKAIALVVAALAAYELISKIIAIASDPWALLAIAVVALAYLIIKYHKQIWETIQKTWTAIKDFVGPIWNATIAPVKAGWEQLVKWWNSYGGQIKTIWNNFWAGLKHDAQIFWNFFGPFIKAEWEIISTIFKIDIIYLETLLKIGWDLIIAYVKIAWGGIKAYFKSEWDLIVGIFQVAIDLLSGHWSKAWTDFKNIFIQIWNNIKAYLGTVLAALVKAVLTIGPEMLNAGKQILQDLWDGMKSIAGGLLSWVGNFAKKIRNAVSSFFQNASPSRLMYNEGKYIVLGMEKGIQDHAHKAVAAAKAASQKVAAAAGSPGPGGGAPGANAALARKLYPAWGSGAEWAAWNNVAMRESGWNQFARNPSSGAYGIPQALPPGKMGAAANPPQSNPTAQIEWMISYIKSVYGDPIGAWNHELSQGWYDKGGWLPTGASIAINNTGRPERVMGPSDAVNVVLSVQGGEADFEKFMATWIKKWTRIHAGGNVQQAFGTGGH